MAKRVNVMVWNVQNFGASTPGYAEHKGDASELLAGFISGVLKAYKIDVFLMLEVMKDAEPDLDSLLYALNYRERPQEWCYDWVKGSVKSPPDTVEREKVQTKDQLSWKSSRVSWRAEGYAVFWRNSQTDRFTMRAAGRDLSEQAWSVKAYRKPIPGHVIELSLTGRCWKDTNDPAGIKATQGFDPNGRAKTTWYYSEYPDVSSFVTRKPRWERSRRPAFVTVDLTVGGGAQKAALPIIGFHAPSKPELARMGTYMSGLAEQLYVFGDQRTPHEKVVAGGDFNVNARTAEEWSGVFAPYWSPYSYKPEGGAECSALNDEKLWTRTTVVLRKLNEKGKRIGPPIVSNDTDDYYSGTIDNIFFRGCKNPSTYTVLIPDMLMQGGLLGDYLEPWYQPLINIQRQANGVNNKTGPWKWNLAREEVPVFASMTDWKGFLDGVKRGYFAGNATTGIGDARNASVFAHDFVSDHLPVVVEFDVA